MRPSSLGQNGEREREEQAGIERKETEITRIRGAAAGQSQLTLGGEELDVFKGTFLNLFMHDSSIRN